MKRNIIVFLAFFIASLGLFSQNELHFKEKVPLVNTLIGTDFHGHTYPGAVAPFGMVQLSPDTRKEGWDGCSGYHYSDTILYGFSHTHLSGTGCSDYADILFMPTYKDENAKTYNETFNHKDEKATAGYYSVRLKNSNIFVELSATERGGYHRYTFYDRNTAPKILIDLEYRDELISSYWNKIDDRTITGFRESKAWNPDQRLFFAARFSKDIKEIKYDSASKRILLYFDKNDEEETKIESIVCLSSVSEEGALKNLNAEKSKNFSEAKNEANRLWEEALGKIDIYGGTLSQQKTFYTALYHCMIAPNLYSDVDGNYLGMDKKIHKAENYERYSVFSLWDTYRALHPLLTIIDQKKTKDFVETALDMYNQSGRLPIWELASHETYCMIGLHGISMIVDAYMKGIRGDEKTTLEALLSNGSSQRLLKITKEKGNPNTPLFGLDYFDTYGYISSEKEVESVSKTLEYAYNMWCIAQMIKEKKVMMFYKEFIEKAQYYKNLYNPKNKFIQPKINGKFLDDFDPKQIDQNYTEGNGWQYGFYVPQDVNGLINLMGGDEIFCKYLDSCFSSKEPTTGRKQADVTGLIGQYSHGNEPSHHIAYLYTYAGESYKTQELVRKILNTLYSDKPDGLCGNEDCGQMSAWYVFSALGFYPVCPGSNEYIIGSPLFDKAVIHLENGKDFTINSPQDDKSPYIDKIKLNGKNYKKLYINHFDIMQGGEISFKMSNTPNKKLGKKEKYRPKSEIKDYPITIVPYFEYEDNTTFTKEKQVYINSINGNIVMPQLIYKDRNLVHFGDNDYKHRDITINESVTIEATSTSEDNVESKKVSLTFNKISDKIKIDLLSKINPIYPGSGKDGLIDKILGTKKWQLGAWMGFCKINFVAIVDLQDEKINRIGANFIQDSRSWIFFPKEINYYTSQDGKTFTLLERVENKIYEKDEEIKTQTFFTTLPIDARYIKVEAISIGQNPLWHLSPKEDAWLFIDEIIIE
ncbi:MAG: GH92 family glycosyl hydrolase [Endomicrobium sp.]|jgi:predicted alpha-1,2-mannosidase|nr:GH92 family glycosyl hydrolase [Endomicrobium sp.]